VICSWRQTNPWSLPDPPHTMVMRRAREIKLEHVAKGDFLELLKPRRRWCNFGNA
jgi:hypothetical protein